MSNSPSDAPPSAVLFTPATTWTFRLKGDTGDLTEVTLRAGRFTSPDKAAAFDDGTAFTASACSADAQRDIVAPIELEVSNANPSLDQPVYVSFYGYDDRAPESSAAIFDFDGHYSSGPTCTGVTRRTGFSGENSLNLESTNPQAPGGSVSVRGYLVVHDFVTSALPMGDESVLRSIGLVLYTGPRTDAGGRVIVEQSGPRGPAIAFQGDRLPLASLVPEGVRIARLIASHDGCDGTQTLRAPAGHTIVVEASGEGASGTFDVTAVGGKRLLRFQTLWAETHRFRFVMPREGRVTVTATDGGNFVVGCLASVHYLDAGPP